VAPGGRAEILALSYVLFSRASLNITIEKAVRLLDMAQHKLQYLLKVFPGDPVAFVLFADVVQLSGIFRNNIEILQDAASHYQQHLQRVPQDSHAFLQCGKLYLYLYYYAGKVSENLTLAHNMAKRAVELNSDEGEAWHLLARVLSLQVTKDKDPSSYAVCDDAFSRAHLLLPNNVYILYRWGRFLLRKSKNYENFDNLLTAAMKLKAAIEKEPKIGAFQRLTLRFAVFLISCF
jgi:tetratricopeptide (TPR) repeat protein